MHGAFRAGGALHDALIPILQDWRVLAHELLRFESLAVDGLSQG